MATIFKPIAAIMVACAIIGGIAFGIAIPLGLIL